MNAWINGKVLQHNAPKVYLVTHCLQQVLDYNTTYYVCLAPLIHNRGIAQLISFHYLNYKLHTQDL